MREAIKAQGLGGLADGGGVELQGGRGGTGRRKVATREGEAAGGVQPVGAIGQHFQP